MHLPDIQLDTALALLPQESRLNSVNTGGERVNALGGGDSFQKLLEKAMNEARAADKARDDERAAKAKDARAQADKTSESRRADAARHSADRTVSADKADVSRAETAKHKAATDAARNHEDLAEDAQTAEQPASDENAFIAKFRAVTDTRLDGLVPAETPVLSAAQETEADDAALMEQKITQGEDSLLLDALASARGQQEVALAGQQEAAKTGEENEPREDLELKKDSAAKRAGARPETMAEAAFFNTQALDANAAVIQQGAQTNAADDGEARTETAGAAKKRDFFDGDKPLFTVIDERAVSSREKPSHVTAVSHEGNHAELQLSLSDAAKGARATLEAAQNGGAESKFSAMLSQEIKNNAYEFVKTGSIILRGNDTGSIRLALHPENLGDVKILLQLTDNNIAARITVATKEAYDAFKSSIDSLKQAFSDSGFSTGDFNLSWTGGGAQGNAQNNHHGQEPSRQAFERAYAQYAGGIPDFDSASDERSFIGIGGLAQASAYAVNIMA